MHFALSFQSFTLCRFAWKLFVDDAYMPKWSLTLRYTTGTVHMCIWIVADDSRRPLHSIKMNFCASHVCYLYIKSRRERERKKKLIHSHGAGKDKYILSHVFSIHTKPFRTLTRSILERVFIHSKSMCPFAKQIFSCVWISTKKKHIQKTRCAHDWLVESGKSTK